MLKRITLFALILMLCLGSAFAASIQFFVNSEPVEIEKTVNGDSCLVEWSLDGCMENYTIEMRDHIGQMIYYSDNRSGNAFLLDRNFNPNAEYYTFEIIGLEANYRGDVAPLVTNILTVEFASDESSLLSPGPMYIYNCQEWVSLRARPNTTSERILKVPFGARVELLHDLGNGYAQVRCTDYVGFMQTQYLTNTPGSSPIPNYSTPGPGTAEQFIPNSNFYELYPDFVPYFNDAEGVPIDFAGGPMADYLFRGGCFYYRVTNCESFVNLREEANAYSDSILQVPKGDYVSVCGDLNGWMLCSYGGRYGWIKEVYLEK